MLRRFGDVKAQLASVAAETGFTVDDARLKTLVDLAQERLLMEGNWPHILERRMSIQVHDGILVLPDEFETVYSVCRSDVGSLKITDSWFTLLPQNQIPGNYPTLTCEDRGETAVYRHPQGMTIKAYSEESSAITIYADHESVSITPTSRDAEPTPTAKKYYDIQRVERAAAGKPFELVYEDEDGVEYFGGRFSGYWPSASLRAYQVGASDFDEVVNVVARRRVIPITDDTTPMIITNVPALRLMLMAITKENAGMIDESEANLQRAVAALTSENKRYHPHDQQPRIDIVSGFGDIMTL